MKMLEINKIPIELPKKLKELLRPQSIFFDSNELLSGCTRIYLGIFVPGAFFTELLSSIILDFATSSPT